MPVYIPSLKTEYEKPIIQPPKSVYGRNIALIGLASSGPFYNPTYIPTLKEAQNQFGSGPLVQAFEETYTIGADAIYLVRLKKLDPFNLLKAFDVLMDLEMHIIVLIGIYFEDEFPIDDLGKPIDSSIIDATPTCLHNHKRYASMFVDFCAQKQQLGGDCIGIMAVRPFDKTWDEKKLITPPDIYESNFEFSARLRADITNKVTTFFNDPVARKGFGEVGYFLSVVFAEAMFFDSSTGKERPTDCAAIYAGLLSTIKPGYSPVNKNLKGVSRLRYSLSGGTNYEVLDFTASSKIGLARRPMDGTAKVFGIENPQEEYYENADFVIDYSASTITRTGNDSYIQDQLNGTYVLNEETGTMEEQVITPEERAANNALENDPDPEQAAKFVKYYVKRVMPAKVLLSYKYDDRDTLASVGFVTMMDFVKAGPSFASSVTMSKNTISLVQDIRMMQSMASNIREVGAQMIGNTNVNLDYLDSYIAKYLEGLIDNYQIISGAHTIMRTDGGKDIIIEIEYVPREGVALQTLRIRLPIPT